MDTEWCIVCDTKILSSSSEPFVSSSAYCSTGCFLSAQLDARSTDHVHLEEDRKMIIDRDRRLTSASSRYSELSSIDSRSEIGSEPMTTSSVWSNGPIKRSSPNLRLDSLYPTKPTVIELDEQIMSQKFLLQSKPKDLNLHQKIRYPGSSLPIPICRRGSATVAEGIVETESEDEEEEEDSDRDLWTPDVNFDQRDHTEDDEEIESDGRGRSQRIRPLPLLFLSP